LTVKKGLGIPALDLRTVYLTFTLKAFMLSFLDPFNVTEIE